MGKAFECDLCGAVERGRSFGDCQLKARDLYYHRGEHRDVSFELELCEACWRSMYERASALADGAIAALPGGT